MRRTRGLRVLVAAAVAAAVAGPGGWMLTDRLEQDDDFCNACHLPTGAPLHREQRLDFDAHAAPASLVAAHGRAGNDARADGAFRCIDCHGGASWLGRARVKLLAAKDAAVYLTGRFEEPEGMRWPLWDEDCAKCHDRFAEGEPEPWRTPRFHELPVHNVELGVACVECHLGHETGVEASAWFLDAPHVRTQCARCHSEFEETQG